MNNRELKLCLERLADDLGLRWVEKSRRYLGIHRGITLEISEWEGVVTFRFVSPAAQLSDQLAKEFGGFAHLAEAGISTSWVKPLLMRQRDGNEEVSDYGCSLFVNADHIEPIGVDTFRRIPDLVVEDLRTFGAEESQTCVNCNQREATAVALLNYCYTPMCDDCWRDVQFRSRGGKLATQQSVNWKRVAPVLIVLTIIGAVLWGFFQQPPHLNRLGLFSLMLPAGWAFVTCWLVRKVSGGVTLALRLSLFASVILLVFAGNIWGFRAAAIEQMEKQFNHPIDLGFVESVRVYILAFPQICQTEIPFLMGGVIGAVIGLRYLKRDETIKVE